MNFASYYYVDALIALDSEITTKLINAYICMRLISLISIYVIKL